MFHFIYHHKRVEKKESFFFLSNDQEKIRKRTNQKSLGVFRTEEAREGITGTLLVIRFFIYISVMELQLSKSRPDEKTKKSV